MTDGAGEVVVRRVVKASRAVAFEAWTESEHVRQWWSPTETARCTLCEIDPRVGGGYRLHMEDPAEGTSCEVTGEFRQVKPPARLVYTWNARTHEGDVENTLVTVEFHARSDHETEVVVRHSGLPDGPIREGHRETWGRMLESFAGFAEVRPAAPQTETEGS